MKFSVLGQLHVAGEDGAELHIPQPRQRALLAVLLLHANQEMSTSRLTESIWDHTMSGVGPGALRTQVWALRKIMAPATRLHTGEHRGYQLEVRPGELDAVRFRELAGQGRRALDSADLTRAVSCLTQALALWGEPPLADVPATLAMAPVIQRLLDERTAAQELLTEARLGLGQHAGLIPELRQGAAADPANERLWEQLMLALHRAGRTAEALAAYQQARASMQAELGLEPGPGLRELHRRILAGDPELSQRETSASAGTGGAGTGQEAATGNAGPAAGGPDGQAAGGGAGHQVSRPASGREREPVVPRQLPAPVQPFVGRDAELAELDDLLKRASGPSAVVISAIGGTAGVGKTALAVHWAHQVADQFPDGQLHVNLRGFDPAGNPTPAATAIRALLDALEAPAERIPASLDAQVGLYRSLMAGKRMLLVLDNARDAEQVRPLLPGSPSCLVLVTSRSHLTGLAAVEGAHSLRLGLLTGADARDLLAARLGPGRVDAEPGAADELVRLCARLPLALAIASARADGRADFPLATQAAELRDSADRLDALDTGDPAASVRSVFSWSYRQLSPAAARMFRLLGLHPGPDISVEAAASLAGCEQGQARRLLATLTRAHLLTEPVPGRFASHDLLRAYAAEQALASGGEAAQREGTGRILDHYLHTACAAAGLLNPQRDAITLAPPRPGVTPEPLTSRQLAQSWLEAEHGVLISVIALAGEAGFDSHAWQLPWAIANFLDWRGYPEEWAATQRAALAAAARLGDTAAQAVTRRLLGQACARLGDYEQASIHLAECTGLYHRLGDQDGEARVQQTLSWLHGELRGDYLVALGHAERAIALYRSSGNQAGQASALNNVGTAHIRLGDPQQGRENCQQSLSIHERLGSLNGQANAWHSLGDAEHHLGDLAQAARCYRRAAGIYHEIGKPYFEAATLTDLGDSRHSAGDPAGARDAWQQALSILTELSHPGAARISAKLRQLTSADS